MTLIASVGVVSPAARASRPTPTYPRTEWTAWRVAGGWQAAEVTWFFDREGRRDYDVELHGPIYHFYEDAQREADRLAAEAYWGVA